MLLDFSRKFFRHFWIYSQNVSAVHISTGKILGFPTFATGFFSFFNFRPEIFPVFTFRTEKNSRKLRNAGASPNAIYDVDAS